MNKNNFNNMEAVMHNIKFLKTLTAGNLLSTIAYHVDLPVVAQAKRTYYTIEEAIQHVTHDNKNRVIFTFK